MTLVFLSSLLTLALLGCGGARATPPSEERASLERLYPMRTGSVWTYDVDTGQGAPILAITRVTSHDGPRVELCSGSDPVRYELRPEGLFRTDRDGYLLKPPFTTGATWDAGGGATAEVTATDRSVETRAGAFTGCIEVRETGSAGDKIVRTLYCPDVGPVEVDSSMSMNLNGQIARVVARLRGYDLSGALGSP